VIIQSFIPENEIVQHLAFNNYKDFFIHTLEERKLFNYPPFCEMVELEYRHTDKQKSYDFAKKLSDKLKKLSTENDIQIIFNEKSFKRNNSYFYKIIIKGNNLHDFLKNIRSEIMRNSGLSVIFHS
jgi:primosomal protein N' (replication factor Y)